MKNEKMPMKKGAMKKGAMKKGSAKNGNLTAAQKKLPPFLQQAIAKKNSTKKK